MKKIFILTVIFFTTFLSFSQEDLFKTSNSLIHNGKYDESLKLLEDAFAKDKNNIKIAWHIAQSAFLMSETVTDKKIRYDYYAKGINACAPFLTKPVTDKRNQAELINWYAVNYSSDSKDRGFFFGRDGLGAINKVFQIIETCIQVDPEYAPAYFFKAKLYAEVPFFFGGDKVKMETNFKLALKYAMENDKPTFLFEAAKYLLDRKWSVENKLNESKKQKVENDALLSVDKDDKSLALEYLTLISATLKANDDLSVKDKQMLIDVEALLKKYQ
jgi:hypothetical protein